MSGKINIISSHTKNTACLENINFINEVKLFLFKLKPTSKQTTKYILFKSEFPKKDFDQFEVYAIKKPLLMIPNALSSRHSKNQLPIS